MLRFEREIKQIPGEPELKIPRGKWRFTYYNGVKDLLDTPVTNPSNQRHLDKSMSQNNDSHSWWGIPKGDGHAVVELAKKGWPEGRERAMNEFAAKIKIPQMPDIVRHRRWKDHGDSVDMQRVYSGAADKAWQIAERGKKSGLKTHVLIMIDMGGHCQRKPDEFFWRGALCALLTNKLVLSGRSVKVVLGHAGYDWSSDRSAPKYIEDNILVKDFHQVLNLDSCILSCALSGFFRSFGFKAILNHPEQATGGLGRHTDYWAYGVPETNPSLFRIHVNDVWNLKQAEKKAQEIANLFEE